MGITRRELIGLAAAGAAAIAMDITADAKEDNMRNSDMPRRTLGKTGEQVSILAFGGFHLMETMPSDAEEMLNYYLDSGGNFIETAVSYGDSEEKIGRVMKHRRSECFLSTKTEKRTQKQAAESINTSLKRLQTDHLDNLFIHNVRKQEDFDAVFSPDGAIAAAEEARKAGKIRFISVTSHSPEMLLKLIQTYPFDCVMEWMNYFDYFNFPLIYERIIPLCREKGVGLIAMKPIADGLLYRSAANALRWAWSLPVASVSAGNNTMDLLKKNIALARSFKPMTDAEREDLYRTAPEYMNYVCRRCENCTVDAGDLDLKAIFGCEGYYDRQMFTGSIPDAAEYALRERLRFWFQNQDAARDRYSKLEHRVPKTPDAGFIQGRCRYGIDIPRKLKIAAWKLTDDQEYLS
jgi:predicted aldo/keto reductase-like oxidoreductase